MQRKSHDSVAVIGIDLGKNTFDLIGLNKRGAIMLRLKVSRSQLETRLSNTPPCLIGMGACVGSHHLARRLKALGHDAKLMPAIRETLFQGTEERLQGCRGDRRGGTAADHALHGDQDRRAARPAGLASHPRAARVTAHWGDQSKVLYAIRVYLWSPESMLGKGSIFRLELPVRAENARTTK